MVILKRLTEENCSRFDESLQKMSQQFQQNRPAANIFFFFLKRFCQTPFIDPLNNMNDELDIRLFNLI